MKLVLPVSKQASRGSLRPQFQTFDILPLVSEKNTTSLTVVKEFTLKVQANCNEDKINYAHIIFLQIGEE